MLETTYTAGMNLDSIQVFFHTKTGQDHAKSFGTEAIIYGHIWNSLSTLKSQNYA